MDDVLNPFHVTTGYLGQPGSRTFFIQWQDDLALVSLLCEKAQSRGLGELLTRVLDEVESTPMTDWDRDAMELREPVQPRWRVGTIGVGLDPEAGRIILELSEAVTEETEDGATVRLWLDVDLARRLAAHAKEVVGEGRPTCELCGRPMRPTGGHVCPATNGYGRLSR